MMMIDKVKRREFIFLIAWTIFTCAAMIETTFFRYTSTYNLIESILKIIRLSSYILCILLILEQKYKRSTIIKLVLMFGVVLLSIIMSRDTEILWCFLFIAAAIGIKIEKITIVSVVTRFMLIGGTILLTKLGFIEDYIFSADTRARHGLGFSWATTGPVLFFFFTIVYIYVRKEKLKVIELIVIELCHIYFYAMTDSRMTFLMGTATIVFFIIQVCSKRKWCFTERLGYLWCLCPTIIAIIAILLHVLFDWRNSIWMALDNLLSGRLSLGYNAFQTYGLSLFGQPIEWVGFDINETTQGYNYVDCSYMRYMLQYGVVFIVLVVVIYTIIIYRGIKNKDYYIVWICLIVLMFCITEPWLFNFTFNPIPVILLTCMKDKKEESDGFLYE